MKVIIGRPTTVADAKDQTFDELYYEISHDWQHKAKQLQIRRWRDLKRDR